MQMPFETANKIQNHPICEVPEEPKTSPQCPPLSIVSVDYTVRECWASGYYVDVTVVVDCNAGSRRSRFGVNGWTMCFELRDAKIMKMWNAVMNIEGDLVTAVHKNFCAPVHRGLAVLYLGFEAKPHNFRTTPIFPQTITVNGQVCAVNGSFAREIADCSKDYLIADSPSPSPRHSPCPSREASPSRVRPEARRCGSAPSVLQLYPFGYADPYDCHGNNTSHTCASAESKDDKEHQRQTSYNQEDRDEEHSVADTLSPFHDDVALLHDLQDSPERREQRFESSCTSSPEELECAQKSASGKRKRVDEDSRHDESSTKTVSRYPRTLTLDYYRRSKALKKRKFLHMDYLDSHFGSREDVIMKTVLDKAPIVLEPNMFPYDTPNGVTHWTLWSRTWLTEPEIEDFVEKWLTVNLPEAIEWNHDDNMADGLSINLFHLHVYIRCPAK